MPLPATLPGIAFEVVPRALDDALPRMDVCGFVGFAARGPIDIPVLVEDPVSFRDVFGDDPVLARTDDGVDVRAYLGPAVEAFFANGGRRAWVVRVARTGEGGAVTNRFGVPGLVVPGPPNGGVAGWRLAALPARSAGAWSDGLAAGATLVVTSLTGAALDDEHLLVEHGSEVLPGDLLRITLAPGEHLLVTASDVGRHGGGSVVAVDPAHGWLVAEGPAIVAGGAAYRLGVDGPVRAPTLAITSLASGRVLEADAAEPLRPGDVVAWEPVPPGSAIGLVVVGEELFDGVGPGTRRFEIAELATVAPGSRDWTSRLSPPAGPLSIETQRVRLTVRRRDAAVEAELDGLGLGAAHPNAVAALPGDDHIYSLLAGLPRTAPGRESIADDLMTRQLTPLERAAVTPRFPLAGPADAPILLPIALTTDPTATVFGPPPAEIDRAPAPVRNGLGRFDAGLFVDPALAGLGIDTLIPAAWDLTYVRQRPHRLRGIHALATNEDITLVCVPDAVHQGWQQTSIRVLPPLAAPVLAPAIVDAGGAHLTWSPVPTAAGYQLEHDHGDWTMPRRAAVGGTTTTLQGWEDCPHIEYVRVRATRGNEVGPWSNVIGMVVPAATFGPCGAVHVPEAPAGNAEPIPDAVVWRARSAAEAEPWTELLAIQTAVLRWGAARGDVFAVLALPLAFTAEQALRHVGVLSAAASTSLSAGVPGLTDDESGVLGYGALYHPWPVIGRADSGGVRAVPPDGGIAGTYAARSLARGAWIAPARVPLANVVALEPGIDERQHLPLVLAGVDPIAADPGGFLTLTANTMTAVAAVRPIGVRRLVMLLRRLARREGVGIVFEPHDHELRRLVAMRFERLLTGLFQRGAFAGVVAAEAFEVSTGDSVNPPSAVDSGRFVVEVRFAPSRPLEFITVKLVLAGPALAEERT